MARRDLTGQRSGRLVVLSLEPNYRVRCQCDCGRITTIRANKFTRGQESCGCVGRTWKHGFSQTPEYRAWNHARHRCFNPRVPNYAAYGGRGITMCDRWRDDFLAFLADMGPRPPGHTLDRLDNNGPYAPDNCRWATMKQQKANQRPRRPGLHRQSTLLRLAQGWRLDRWRHLLPP